VMVASADATIFAEQTGGTAYDAVADGSGPNLWTSVIAAGVVRRALLRFDLSMLPPGSQVLEAHLDAFMIRLREPQTIALHRITAGWSEGASNGGDAGIGAPATQGTAPGRTACGRASPGARAVATMRRQPAPVLRWRVGPPRWCGTAQRRWSAMCRAGSTTRPATTAG
ncbi:MAG: hypothetical protein HC793_00845, partial [Aquincola sp.]|nr:hypothetical protein [Aquincola sp.]